MDSGNHTNILTFWSKLKKLFFLAAFTTHEINWCFNETSQNVNLSGLHILLIKRQSHKIFKHTQTIRRQFTDDLFECVRPFCGVRG